MTKAEVDRFQAILTAKVAELDASSAGAMASRSSEVLISWKRSRRLRNAHLQFETSPAILTKTLDRPPVISKEGNFGTCQRL
jgi:hypothetical protein